VRCSWMNFSETNANDATELDAIVWRDARADALQSMGSRSHSESHILFKLRITNPAFRNLRADLECPREFVSRNNGRVHGSAQDL